MRLIDADAVMEKISLFMNEPDYQHEGENWMVGLIMARDAIDEQPTIQPEPHEIGYDDCANALLKMWMDDVLTDGEYYRIANKLNVKWGKIEVPESYKGVTE